VPARWAAKSATVNNRSVPGSRLLGGFLSATVVMANLLHRRFYRAGSP